MGFISVKQYTPKGQVLSMFFGSKNQTKKEVLQFKRKGLGNKGQHICSANASHK